MIHFTTDGSNPTAASPIYTGALTLTDNATVRAIAVKDGMAESLAAAETFSVMKSVVVPVITPGGGTFTDAVAIAITSATPEAVIHFTTDGSIPTAASPIYNGPFTLSQSATVTVFAMHDGMVDSGISSATFTVQATAPSITPSAGTFADSVNVALSTSTPGAAIHYTLDGSLPSEDSPIYSGPFVLSQSAVVSAITTKPGVLNSGVTTATLVVQPTASAPIISPAGGVITSPTAVSVSSATAGAETHYTLDGSIPSAASPLYSGEIILNDTATVRAIATGTGVLDSPVTTAAFTFMQTAALPVISPGGGEFTDSVLVQISTPTTGEIIRYTTDGTQPSDLSPAYSAQFRIKADATISAATFKSGWVTSDVARADFAITASAPFITPAGGAYKGSVTVGMAAAVPGSIVRYTVDGSDPSGSSSIVSTPLTLTSSATLRAVVTRPGVGSAEVASASFTVDPAASVAAPVISPAGASTTGPALVTITSATPNAAIYYTTDGTNPTSSSSLYYGAFSLSLASTVKAVATASGVVDSAIATAKFTPNLSAQAPLPAITPNGASFNGWTTVSISTTSTDATIRYTTDGSEPNASSSIYVSSFTVCSTKTIKARAFLPGAADSDLATAVFTSDATAPVEISVATFGAVPDDGLDDTVACANALKACANQFDGTKPRRMRLVFPTGTYNFSYGKNTVTNEPDRALPVQGCNNLEIDGKGSTLLFSLDASWRSAYGFFCYGDNNITIKNFTFDVARPSFSSGTVINTGWSFFDVQIESEFPVTGTEPIESVAEYDPLTRLPARYGIDVNGGYTSIALIGPQQVRVSRSSSISPMKTGMFLNLRHANYGPRPVSFDMCGSVQLENLTLYGSVGNGIVPMRTEDVSLRQVRTMRPPNSTRLASTASDATHFLSCKGTIYFEDCDFESQGDDAINVQGRYYTVTSIVNSKTIRVNYAFAPTANPYATANEPFEFRSGASLALLGEGRAQSAVIDSTAHTALLTFSAPLPAGLAVNDVIASLGWTPRLRVTRSNFIGNRARGILVQTRDVSIENSLFRNVSGSAIDVTTSLYWAEAGGTRDVSVRNNSFENCDYGVSRAGGVIYALAELRDRTLSSALVHRGLSISDNTIANCDNAGIFVTAMDGFEIVNNTLQNLCRLATVTNGDNAIYIGNAQAGRVFSNSYATDASFAKPIKLGLGTVNVSLASNAGFSSGNFNQSAFVSQTVPSEMTAGASYTVSVTMQNTGSSSWSADNMFRLGPQNPQDTRIWGPIRAAMSAPAAPGSHTTFTFVVTAPTAPGIYNFQWRMLQEAVEWFGAFTPNMVVTVH
ncbi:MAG: large repetitive protein [Chthoniobacter sp.]|nr:large repetitive protein [Chthoniobacter sp.]